MLTSPERTFILTLKGTAMEPIGKKIRRMIRDKGFRTVKDFYQVLSSTFEQTAINRSTLTRILKDRVEVRERSLNQIALILGVRTSALREGTNAEVSAMAQPERVFTYNDKAAARVLETGLPFMALRLTLKKAGRTAPEQDSSECTQSVKWVYILVGKIKVIVEGADGERTTTLHKSQAWSFDARRRHHFENASANTSLGLIIHHPARNNRLFTNA